MNSRIFDNEASVSAPLRAAYTLAATLAAAVVVQALGGLFIKGLYRDNAWVVSIYRGTDWVTLLAAAPLLIWSLIAAKRGSLRARLIMIGMTDYVFYNNIYYLFTSFNRFFLVYVAIFILSLAALIAGLVGIDPARTVSLEARTRRTPVCVGMILCAAILAVMWIGQSLVFVANGVVPQLIIDTGGTTHMVAALDLTLIVPPLVLGAVWLRRNRPWGMVISIVTLVQCAMISLVLMVGTPFQAVAGVKDAWTMFPLWAFMAVVFLVSAVYLLKHIMSGPGREAAAQ